MDVNSIKIKVCGMRKEENIKQVSALGVDMLGFIFWPKSPRYVHQIPSKAGIVPDFSSLHLDKREDQYSLQKDALDGRKRELVGVFVDDMPQNIVTRVYNYHLDYVQLHGDESPEMIDNLKRTLIPDIAPDIKIIKALSIKEADDVKRWREYKGHADLLLFDTKCKCVGGSGEQFDWSVLEAYDGDIPFILSGGIGPEDVERIKTFCHPMCIGIDLNSKFETEPALKDVDKLKKFIDALQ